MGIDFGAAGIKAIQLEPADGRGKLFTYGFSEFPPENVGNSYLEDVNAASGLLKTICAKARTTTAKAVAALPIPAVFSAVLSIAPVAKKELRQAVEWEAKKLIPLPLEEVTLDFRELTRGESTPENKERPDREDKKEKGTMEVLLTAAPKGTIDNYVNIAKNAGLTLASLETEAFALIRSLVGSDPTPSVILDIGAVRSNILIVDRGIPMLTRSVEIGGKKCTEAIANNLSINLTQAEVMKRDIGGPSGSLKDASGPGLPEILREVLTPLINELKYSFGVYKTRNAVVRQPERILLTGGGAGILGLADFFAAEFNLRTFLANPWEKVEYHPDLSPILQTLGSRFAVAIGLALRNI